MNEFFRKIAHKTSEMMGSPWSFILAVIIVLIWIGSGPNYQYSDTWQLVINTGTTILTFLMVFLIQNTQNRDNRAVQLKLDELLRSIGNARNSMVDLEDLSDQELDQFQKEFKNLRNKYTKKK